MNSHVLQTKMKLPMIPEKSLYSERIRKLHIHKYRLAVLVAPAGFGKTTAVLLSLKNFRNNIRWYRMEKEDSFLPVFYNNILSLLFSEREEDAGESIHMFNSIQDLSKEYLLLNAQIVQDITYFTDNNSETIYLVFDDYHNVIENEEIRNTLQYFATNMPDRIHIIITSRAEPMILNEKMLLDPDFRQFQAKDLLFDEDEIRTLVKTIYKMEITEKQLFFLKDVTEGWIAGINIICHSNDFLQDTFTDLPINFGDSFFSAFLHNFLSGVDPEKKELLMKISVLDDFSVEELKAIFKQEKAHDFIKWLETSNLYLQKIQGEPARYRFHSLFSRELVHLYKTSTPLKQQSDLFKDIADFYREEDTVKSISYYLKADIENEAFLIAEKFIQEGFSAGTPERCFSCLNPFSNEQILKNPYLLFIKAMKIININRKDAQTYLILSMDGLKKRKDYLFLMNSFGMIMVISFQTNDFSFLEQAAKKIPVLSIFKEGGKVQTEFTISLFISYTGNDNLIKAKKYIPHLDSTVIESEMWHFSYLMIRGIYYYRSGNLKASRLNLENILAHPVIKSNDQWRIIGLVSCCNVSFLLADQALMQFFIHEFFLLGEKYNSSFSLGYAYYITGFQKYIMRDMDKALEAFNHASEYYSIFGSEVLVREVEIITQIMNEDSDPASMLLKAHENLHFFNHENHGHGIAELAETALGILYKRMKEYKKSEKFLLRSLSKTRSKKTLQDMYGIYMHLSDLYFLMGNNEKGLSYFSKWAKLGEDNNFFYASEMDFSSLERILKKTENETTHETYCHNIKILYFKNNKYISQKNINIQFFGNFRLEYNGIILSDKDFKTRKVSGLLKYILAKNTPQSRSHLADIFWPDTDHKSAYTSLRVALYELRKSLSEHDLRFEGDQAIIEETKEGLCVGGSVNIQRDTDRFEYLYHYWKSNSSSDEINCLIELCDLYCGFFLDNDEYDDWVIIQKEHYHSMYAEAIHTLGKKALTNTIHNAEKYLLRSLEFDPLDEKSCALLISLYQNKDQYDRAKALERQFSKRFKKEMGIEPNLFV